MRSLLGWLLVGTALTSQAQVLQKADLVDEWTRGEARTGIAKGFKMAENQPDPICAVELYQVKYWSTGVTGEKTLLSGLVALPIMSKCKGLVAFMHGTTAVRDNVPSRMRYDGQWSYETWLVVLALGNGGYAVAAPDYIGQGDSPGVHPYVLGSVNAASGIDILKAAKELAEQKHRAVGSKLYVTGYSEGGSNAMWLARKIEEANDPSLVLTAAAPVSGPYDLSGAQADGMLATQTSLMDVAVRLFFMSYFAYGLNKNYNAPPLEDVFIPSYATYVPVVFGRDFTIDNDYVKQLAVKGVQLGTFRSVGRVLTDPLKKAIAAKDKSNPVVEAMLEQDCIDWSPKAPLYLLGIPGDNMVVFQNTRNAIAAMRKRGLTRDRVNYHALDTKGLNHLNACGPLMSWVRRYFDEGFTGVPLDD